MRFIILSSLCIWLLTSGADAQVPVHHAHTSHACGMDCIAPQPVALTNRRTLDRVHPNAFSQQGAGLEDGSIIDILVVYTPDAVAIQGGNAQVESLIQAGLDELNAACTASTVNTTFRLVHVEEAIGYGQVGTMGQQLARLRDPYDGVLDNIHDLRDQHRADLVMLVVGSGDVCGIAYIGVGIGNTPTPDLGFSVVSSLCVTQPVSAFAHEVGHNMGLIHGYEEQPCTYGSSTFAKGYQAPDESFNTVMGVGSGPRQLVFSSPLVDVGGQPAGISAGMENAADSATALMLSAPVVANYRSRDMNTNGVDDRDEIIAGTLNDCDENGYPDFADPDFDRNGVPDACDIALGAADADFDGLPDSAEVSVIRVNHVAVGAGTGASWADAMPTLEDAFVLARASGDVDEIWVASGVYKPGLPGRRASTFDFPGGVTIYGGFDGTEVSPAERTGVVETVLSGDLNGDDGPDLATRADNAVRIGTVAGEDDRVTLDGLVFEGGMADFKVNCALFSISSGLMILDGDATVRNCEFRNNVAIIAPALLVSDQATAIIEGSWFHHNRAIDGLFFGSTGVFPYKGYIGAVRLDSNIDGPDNRFVGNLVEFNRDEEAISGIAVIGSEPVFANNVIARNTSGSVVSGAALSIVLSEGIEIVNSTIANNEAPDSSGIRAAGVAINRAQATFKNTIIWGNSSAGIADEGAQFSQAGLGVAHEFRDSIVQAWTGGLVGVNTSGADPLFANGVGGDYSLGPGSAAIDTGDNAALPTDDTDLDADMDTIEFLPVDFLGNARRVDDPATADTGPSTAPVVDAGAIEFQPGIPCPVDLAAPFGDLDSNDVIAYLSAFATDDPSTDLADPVGTFDFFDIALFLANIGAGCP